MMDFEYIRSHYKVPAERGRRVICAGAPGIIVKAINQYIGVQLDGSTVVNPYHPTDGVVYGEIANIEQVNSLRKWDCLAPWKDEFDSSAWFSISAETRSKARYAAFKYLRDDCELEIENEALLYIKVRAASNERGIHVCKNK